jgi:hypothetical protein
LMVFCRRGEARRHAHARRLQPQRGPVGGQSDWRQRGQNEGVHGREILFIYPALCSDQDDCSYPDGLRLRPYTGWSGGLGCSASSLQKCFC